MTDGQYKKLSEIILDNQEYFISVAVKENYIRVKCHAWLQLMGLFETWDISNDR